MGVYCGTERCEYNENGCCEYEGSISLNENRVCMSFRYKYVYTNNKEEVRENYGK